MPEDPDRFNPKSAYFQELISEELIAQRVALVAEELSQEYRGRPLVVVAVLKGALCLLTDLIKKMDIPLEVAFIQASSYKGGTTRGKLTIHEVGSCDFKGKDLLLIDDICDSGATLKGISEALKEKQPASLKTLVLLKKNLPREPFLIPDRALFEIEDLFVVGYGLDYQEKLRNLPSIYVYKEHL